MTERGEVLARQMHDRPPAKPRTWYLLSSHGIVSFYIATHPDCTIKDVTEALFLARRSIWGLVGDLRGAGMVRVRKSGRRHHHFANPDARLNHPVFQGRTLGEIIGEMLRQGWLVSHKPEAKQVR